MPAHPSSLAPELGRRLAQRRGDEGKGVRQALRSVCPSGRAQGWGGGTPQQSSLVLMCLRRRVFFTSYSCRCGFKSPVTFKCSAPAPAQGTETASWKLNWLQQRGQSPFPTQLQRPLAVASLPTPRVAIKGREDSQVQ